MNVLRWNWRFLFRIGEEVEPIVNTESWFNVFRLAQFPAVCGKFNKTVKFPVIPWMSHQGCMCLLSVGTALDNGNDFVNVA